MYRPVPPQVDLPALEHEVLAFWREHDVFARSLAPPPRAAPLWVFYEGPPTANGMPGTHHVEARVFKDVFPRFRTMKGYHVPRKAGWDCHGLPVELAVEKELGFTGKPDIEKYGDRRVQRQLPGVGAAPRRRVRRDDDAHGLLGRHRRRVLDDGTRTTSRASGGRSRRSSTRACWCRTTGSRRTARAAAPACPTTSWRRATRRSSTPRSTSASRSPAAPCWPAPGAGPAGLDHHPLDAGVQHRRRGQPATCRTSWRATATARYCSSPSRLARAGARRGQRSCSRPLPVPTSWGTAYARPFDLVDFPKTDAPLRTVLADYVTTDDGSGLVHQAPAFGAEDLELCRDVRPAGGQPASPGRPLRRRPSRWSAVSSSRRPTRSWSTTWKRADCSTGTCRIEHSYPHCWRCHTPLVYYAQPSWYIRTTAIKDQLLAREREDRLAPRDDPVGPLRRLAGQQRRLGAVAQPLLGHAAADLALRRGSEPADRASGRWPSSASWRALELSALDPHRPFVDDITFDCSGGYAGMFRRVPEVIDGWYDSGADAVRPVGLPASRARRLRAALPGRLHLRGDRPDPRLVLHADGGRHAGVRPVLLRERPVPGPHPRRGRPQDEQAPRQHPRADPADGRARRRRRALVHAGRRARHGRRAGSATARSPRSSARRC